MEKLIYGLLVIILILTGIATSAWIGKPASQTSIKVYNTYALDHLELQHDMNRWIVGGWYVESMSRASDTKFVVIYKR